MSNVTVKENDEQYTPRPLAQYMVSMIPSFYKKRKVWNPFAVRNDTISKALRDAGFKVYETGFQLDGSNFFEIVRDFIKRYEIQLIVTNIPFSKKNKIFEVLLKYQIQIVTPMPSRAIGGQGLYKIIEKMYHEHLIPFNVIFLPTRVPYNYRNNNVEPSFLLYQIPLTQTTHKFMGTTQIANISYDISSADVRAIIERRCSSCLIEFDFCMCCKKHVQKNHEGKICPCIARHPNLSEKKWCSDSASRDKQGILCPACVDPTSDLRLLAELIVQYDDLYTPDMIPDVMLRAKELIDKVFPIIKEEVYYIYKNTLHAGTLDFNSDILAIEGDVGRGHIYEYEIEPEPHTKEQLEADIENCTHLYKVIEAIEFAMGMPNKRAMAELDKRMEEADEFF